MARKRRGDGNDSATKRRSDREPLGDDAEQPDSVAHLHALHRRHGNRAVGQLVSDGVIQPKLAVSRPGDQAEREAERVADALTAESMAGTDRRAGRETSSGPADSDVESTPAEGPLGSGSVRIRRSTAGRRSSGDTNLARDIESLGTGRKLPPAVRTRFEETMGQDFSDVRVVTGNRADTVARSIDARAFTYGRTVVFRNGEYAPHTTEGERLLAHELTHVVQQNGGADRAVQRQESGSAFDVTALMSGESPFEGAGGASGTSVPPVYLEGLTEFVEGMSRESKIRLAKEFLSTPMIGGDGPEEVTGDEIDKDVAYEVYKGAKKEIITYLAEPAISGSVTNVAAAGGLGSAQNFLSILARCYAGPLASTVMGTFSLVGLYETTKKMLLAFGRAQNPYSDVAKAMGASYGVIDAYRNPGSSDYPDPPSDLPSHAHDAWWDGLIEGRVEGLLYLGTASPHQLVATFAIYKASDSEVEKVLNKLWNGYLGGVKYSTAKELAPERLSYPEPQGAIRGDRVPAGGYKLNYTGGL